MQPEAISKEDAVRLAVAELGVAPAPVLARLIEQRFGVKIEPKFLPVYKASLRGRDHLEQSRRARAVSAEKAPDAPLLAG